MVLYIFRTCLAQDCLEHSHYSSKDHVREGPLLNVTKGSTRQLQQQHQELGRGGSTPPSSSTSFSAGGGQPPPAAAPAFPGVVISPKKSACGKMDSSNRACEILGGHFHRKKSACGKLVSSNGACQNPGWSFSPKSSACGKLDSSNRACNAPDGHLQRNGRGGGGLPT